MNRIISLTNRYIIIATPLLLFTFFVSIYSFVIMRSSNLLGILFALILIILMTGAFCAGWGNMIKSAVSEKNYDEPYQIIKDFIPGVGEYFLSVTASIGILGIINILVLALTYFAGINLIGDIGITSEALTRALASNEALKAFLISLDSTQLLKLNMWNFLILSVMSVMYFVMMFYPSAVFLESKNPLKALAVSVKKIFSRKFMKALGFYLLIFVINFAISISSALFAGNNIMSFLMTLINFYFICCVSIGIFYFYKINLTDSHLGNSIDTYI